MSKLSAIQTLDKTSSSKDPEVLTRAYEREKKRRLHAEAVLENKSRELYLSYEELSKYNAELKNANKRLAEQRNIITGLSDSYQKVTSDLNIAAKAQMDLLPGPLNLPEISAYGVFRPAEFIAGDGYDYFSLNEELFAFYVIDVAGHGIAAALVSFAVQIHLNPKIQGICQNNVSNSDSISQAVHDTLLDLNEVFYFDDNLSKYFTMVYGIVELKSGLVTFGQAGHPAPMLYKRNKHVVTEEGSSGHPVAMFSDPSFGITQCQLSMGDRLVIYSDGATECLSNQDEEFGSDRLAEEIKKTASVGLVQSSHEIAETLVAWNDAPVFDDDISILMLEYQGGKV